MLSHKIILSSLVRHRSVIISHFHNTRRCCSTFPNIPSIRELEKELHDQSTAARDKVKHSTSIETKSMKSSYQEACIELGSKKDMAEKYINFRPTQQDNTIRIGRLLEDLDTFAVWICSQHNRRNGQKTPLVFVTKMVDRIVLDNAQISPARDIKMIGGITWTGKTSMQVSMKLSQKHENGKLQDKLKAAFVMVARDPTNTESVPVNQIKPETPDEKSTFDKAEAEIERRKQQDEESLLKIAPTPNESEMVHGMFTNSLSQKTLSFSIRVKPDNMVWMEDVKLKNVFICFPEQRNMYNKIFGGYLMRKAIEIAYAVALVHSKSPVIFRCIDNIKFELPVEVGSLLYMRSQVTYTKREFMQVRVHAEVVNPETGERHDTNLFNFTVAAKSDVKRVVPKEYGESMLYLDGRRHFKEFEKLNFNAP